MNLLLVLEMDLELMYCVFDIVCVVNFLNRVVIFGSDVAATRVNDAFNVLLFELLSLMFFVVVSFVSFLKLFLWGGVWCWRSVWDGNVWCVVCVVALFVKIINSATTRIIGILFFCKIFVGVFVCVLVLNFNLVFLSFIVLCVSWMVFVLFVNVTSVCKFSWTSSRFTALNVLFELLCGSGCLLWIVWVW